MLTYTFSMREKVLLALLAFVGIIVAWYQLVFMNIQNQISNMDAEIATLSEEFTVNQARAMQLSSMRDEVGKYQEQGLEAVLLPAFDNTQNLMAYLNGVLSTTQGYNISFDTPTLSEEDGTVHRTGTVSYNTASYQEARSIAENIARGPYTCEIEALGITDNTVAKGASAKDAVVTNLQVTFFEKPTKNVPTADDKNEVKGQDLSKLSEWNS